MSATPTEKPSIFSQLRSPQALNYLIGLIESEDRDAPAAIEALAKLSPGAELRARMEQAIEETGSARLRKMLEEHLPASAS